MTRKLASIQKILNIRPIEGADKIEVATILGWECIVMKNEFKVGDLVCYFEIDSLIPLEEKFKFLEKFCATKKNDDDSIGYRIKTIRMRKQISQGLVLPCSILVNEDKETISVEEGMDVTDYLGVKLYQPPIPATMKGLVKGNFPSFIPKTDETRVQLLQNVLTRNKGTKCYITEKIDGTSVTFYLKRCEECNGTGKTKETTTEDGTPATTLCGVCKATGFRFGVCSRNLELIETEENLYWKTAREFQIEERMRGLSITSILGKEEGFAIQGEIYGTNIQNNPLKIADKRLAIFNVFDITRYSYYDYEGFRLIVDRLGLNTVPILNENYIINDNINELVELSKGKSVINKERLREGIVIRPLTEKVDLQMSSGFGNGRFSFKVINPDYLIEVEQ